MNPRKLPPQPSNQGLVCSLAMHDVLQSIVFDESQNGFNGVPTNSPVPKYPGFDLVSGSSIYIDVGAGPSSVKTTSMWFKPDDVTAHTDSPIDLNGTDFLTVVNGTLTKNGFAGGTAILYTDGVAAAVTLTAGRWYHIGITDTSAKNASDFDIGRETGNYTDGIVAGVRLYSTLLTPVQMKNLYELTRWRFSI
ncbi:hypothetical protein LCGC14_0358250 [marine sediment metagenome]|uniref:LamG-like jellyroll fold domain-containing protein n=1 Tax=marine sediment metagenome TaxID=412755 RepID=A0A0F9TEK8_9ZZZZ